MGALIVILLTQLVGNTDYNGAGTIMIQSCFYGKVPVYAFLLKVVFTAVTMGSGFKGGEIIPSFFIGATLGNAFGQMVGMEPSFAAAVGMVCVFCSVVNCPLASIMIGIELFGTGGVIYYALCCGVCFIISGYYSLYQAQRFAYSKTPVEEVESGDTLEAKRPEDWRKKRKRR